MIENTFKKCFFYLNYSFCALYNTEFNSCLATKIAIIDNLTRKIKLRLQQKSNFNEKKHQDPT